MFVCVHVRVMPAVCLWMPGVCKCVWARARDSLCLCQSMLVHVRVYDTILVKVYYLFVHVRVRVCAYV